MSYFEEVFNNSGVMTEIPNNNLIVKQITGALKDIVIFERPSYHLAIDTDLSIFLRPVQAKNFTYQISFESAEFRQNYHKTIGF